MAPSLALTPARPVAFRSLTDDELMRRMKHDDTDAFELLYERHEAPALAAARAIHYNAEMVRDVVQDVFLDVWRGRASYDHHRGQFAGWLMTIVRHRAIDSMRRNGPRDRLKMSGEHHLESLPAPATADAGAGGRADAQALRDLVQKLPFLQRQVIVLGFFGGFTHTEIARHLRLPLGTVKGRMRLGLGALRDGIDD